MRERFFEGKLLLAETYCYNWIGATGFEPAT